jgi:hypothetical protein
MKWLWLLLSLLLPGPALAGSCPALPYTLTNGTTADATQVMANFNSVLGCFSDKLAITDSTASTSSTTGSITTVGGLGVGGAINAAGNIKGVGVYDNGVQVVSTSANNMATISAGAITVAVPRDMIAGYVTSNDTGSAATVLDIAAGQAADSTNATLISLASAITKSTGGSWSAGTGAGGMGVGLTIAASTWYYVFAIEVSGSVDVYFDTSLTAANKPAGTTAFRRVGAFETDGSANILAFTQYPGGDFIWATPVLDYGPATAPTSMTAKTLADVPLGLNVKAFLQGTCANASVAASMWISDLASSITNGPVCVALVSGEASAFGRIAIWTTTSQQVYVRAAASTTANIAVIGWHDPRGQDL